ncbi:MAG: CotH kinase family protein [Oscillospiraceae bacterium]|nr:CotH kinase family protein [Oscillospiraceae bacterium]
MKLRNVLAAFLAAVMTISLCACSTSVETSSEPSSNSEMSTESELQSDSEPHSESSSESIPESLPESSESSKPESTSVEEPPEQSGDSEMSTDSEPHSESEPSSGSEPHSESSSESISESLPESSKPESSKPESSKPESVPVDKPIEQPEANPALGYHAEKADSLKKLYAEISAQKDFPAINITTYMSEPILSKNRYLDAVIDVFNCGESFELSAVGGVKVRGNSTASQGDELPYRIKFDKKQNMLGLHNGREYKSWVLLRSFWNLAPDYMGLNLARAIFDGKYYSSDCAYVNLYVNGQSRGVYLLCEQNQAAKGRVDVAEPTGEESPLEIGYLLEMDNYPDEKEHPFFAIKHNKREFTDILGQSRGFATKCYSIRSDTTTQEQRKFIERYLNGVFTILFEAAEGKPMMLDENFRAVSAVGVYATPREAVEAVIDTRSLANMLILEELVQDYDVGEGSFYMAVDFSENSIYPRLTFLAPWDFNWGYTEEPSSGFYACAFQEPIMESDRSNVWFITAMKQEWFADIVKEKWRDLSESGAIIDTVLAVREHTALLANDLGEDAWKVDQAANICEYVSKRVKFLNKEWLD